MREKTLILDASFELLSAVNSRRAVGYMVKNKGYTILESDTQVQLNGTSVPIPLIYVLNEPKAFLDPTHYRPPHWTRRRVLERDGYECAYCTQRRGTTIDHIVPRALGGKDEFLNTVACCVKCNGDKGHKTLEEWGRELRFMPYVPAKNERAHRDMSPRQRDFLVSNGMEWVIAR